MKEPKCPEHRTSENMARSAAAVFVAIICCLAVLLPQASAQNNADERSGNKVKTCAGGQGRDVYDVFMLVRDFHGDIIL